MVPLPGIVPSPTFTGNASSQPRLQESPSLDLGCSRLYQSLGNCVQKDTKILGTSRSKTKVTQKVAEQGWDKIKPRIKFVLRYRASWASLVSQMVKNLPAMPETQV